MKKMLGICALLLVAATPTTHTQSLITGRWIGALVSPQGVTRELAFDLKVDGSTVTGTVSGRPIREGRVDASTVTFALVNPNDPRQLASFVGQLDGDEIVFRVTGVVPFPMRFVARRDLRRNVSASIRDRDIVQQLNVPRRQHCHHPGFQGC